MTVKTTLTPTTNKPITTFCRHAARSIIMAKVLAQITVKLPRLMEAGEYRKLRYVGGKPSLQQLKKWIEEGEVIGEVKGGMYFVDVQAAIMGSSDPLLAKMLEIG
jgi:rhodanese-related sulfurtransferase